MQTNYINMKINHFLIVSLSMFLLACSTESTEVSAVSDVLVTNVNEIVDMHSMSNVSQVKTKHLHLELAVDFEGKTLIGTAKHTIENVTGTSKIIFDTKQLDIKKVELDNGELANYRVIKGNDMLGDALEVEILAETKNVTIFYKTQPSSEAIQWLNPQQTAGKEQPFLFTQGEAVLTRSWIPLQDTPSNRRVGPLRKAKLLNESM